MTASSPDDQTAARPELVEVPEQTTAVVAGVVPMTELPGFFDRSFGLLGSALAVQGATLTSAAFALYRGAPTDVADLEVGFVTPHEIEPSGEVVPGRLPAGTVARLVHSGSFDGLGEAWGRLGSWIGEQGRTPGPTMWEVYLTEPSPDMDPADLRTELNWLLEP